MLWYNPTLDQDMPSWVYASWAIGLFLYQTFDAVDGTQAYVEFQEINRLSLNIDAIEQEKNASEWAFRRALRPWYVLSYSRLKAG